MGRWGGSLPPFGDVLPWAVALNCKSPEEGGGKLEAPGENSLVGGGQRARVSGEGRGKEVRVIGHLQMGGMNEAPASR